MSHAASRNFVRTVCYNDVLKGLAYTHSRRHLVAIISQRVKLHFENKAYLKLLALNAELKNDIVL